MCFTLFAHCIQYLEICPNSFHPKNLVTSAFADVGYTNKNSFERVFPIQNKQTSTLKILEMSLRRFENVNLFKPVLALLSDNLYRKSLIKHVVFSLEH